jgi:hypothetical protein
VSLVDPVPADHGHIAEPGRCDTVDGRGSIPSWLARWCWSAWTVVGVAVAAAAAVAVLAALLPILGPLAITAVLASVLLPAVGWLAGRGVPVRWPPRW